MEPGITTKATVIDVHDGDTLTVEIKRTVRVRLLNCYAPELKEPGGQEARDFLRKMVSGKEVVLTIPTSKNQNISDNFTFGRVLGHVYLGETNVAEELICHRHATRTK